MSADHAYTASDFPVLAALMEHRGTPYGDSQPGLNDIADVALAPTTRKRQLGLLGDLWDYRYPDVPNRRPSLPLWCESKAPTCPARDAADGPMSEFLEEAVFDAFYSDTPVGLLLTRHADVPTAVSARIITLPLPTLPLGAPVRVVVDLAWPSDDAGLPIGDFHRGRLGLQLAAEMTDAQLLASETRTVFAEDRIWLRHRTGEGLRRRYLPDPHPSNNADGIRALREAHSRVVVERIPHKLGVAAEAYIAAGNFDNLDGLAAAMTDQIVAQGPFLAMSAISAAVEQGL